METISTSKARGQVEKWLLELEIIMKKSIHQKIKESFEDYPNQIRHQWVLLWPGQCVQSISLTYWTLKITNCLFADDSVGKLTEYFNECQVQISEIVKLVRGYLSAQNRITLGALVVLDVHARDTLIELIGLKVSEFNDFSWLSQVSVDCVYIYVCRRSSC